MSIYSEADKIGAELKAANDIKKTKQAAEAAAAQKDEAAKAQRHEEAKKQGEI